MNYFVAQQDSISKIEIYLNSARFCKRLALAETVDEELLNYIRTTAFSQALDTIPPQVLTGSFNQFLSTPPQNASPYTFAQRDSLLKKSLSYYLLASQGLADNDPRRPTIQEEISGLYEAVESGAFPSFITQSGGRYDKTLEYLEEAKQINDSLNAQDPELYQKMADMYSRNFNFNKAEQYLEELIAESPPNEDLAEYYNRLGDIYLGQADAVEDMDQQREYLEKALTNKRKAEAILREIGKEKDDAILQNNLAVVTDKLARNQQNRDGSSKSQKEIRDSLSNALKLINGTIRKLPKGSYELAIAENNRAIILQNLGRNEEAISGFNDAFDTWSKLNDTLEMARSINLMSKLRYYQGSERDLQISAELADAALQLMRGKDSEAYLQEKKISYGILVDINQRRGALAKVLENKDSLFEQELALAEKEVLREQKLAELSEIVTTLAELSADNARKEQLLTEARRREEAAKAQAQQDSLSAAIAESDRLAAEERARANLAQAQAAQAKAAEEAAKAEAAQAEAERLIAEQKALKEKAESDSLRAQAEKKALEDKAREQEAKRKEAEAEAQAARQRTFFITVGVVAASILGFLLIYLLIIGQKNRRLRSQNQQIKEQNEEINSQKEEIIAQRDAIDKQRQKADELLLNILPLSVARELKETSKVTPKSYQMVSVLFTDFKGFTNISSDMTPEQVIAELDNCFRAFERITKAHKLEKIKTIGDAYMCAGGIPEENQTNAIDAVKAGLEIQAFMNQLKAEKIAQGKPTWEIRLGINTGPLVAGVIGEQKYAYDIWGDTVNVASRMESSGEVGKVNISGFTYELIKNHFDCTYRGKIDAKNKGKVDMYFVNSIKNGSANGTASA